MVPAKAVVALAVLFLAAQAAPASGSGELDAFVLCKHAIKNHAKNPTTAEIPHVVNRAQSGGYFYYWKRGDGLRLQNGLGALNDAEASCIVLDAPLRVVSLKIDGVRLIHEAPKGR